MLFNLSPFKIAVIILVALVVFGPERLPELAKDAARMIKTLRELAQGAQVQLRDELGPELADFDLRSLNPRAALHKALFTDDEQSSPVAAQPRQPAAAHAGQSAQFVESEAVSQPTPPLGRGETVPYDADAT